MKFDSEPKRNHLPLIGCVEHSDSEKAFDRHIALLYSIVSYFHAFVYLILKRPIIHMFLSFVSFMLFLPMLLGSSCL
jgi:hypothetical protein